jgi:hypothetical protein
MRKVIVFFSLFVFLLTWGVKAESLRLDRIEYCPGENIKVHFTAPANLPDNAWKGIIPSAVMHGNESENDKHDLTYQY